VLFQEFFELPGDRIQSARIQSTFDANSASVAGRNPQCPASRRLSDILRLSDAISTGCEIAVPAGGHEH
jgi:hypothetical protein